MGLKSVDIDTGDIVQICPNCGVENTITIASLELGTMDDPNIIVMPVCSCGSFEWLSRSWDTHPAATATGQRATQRKAVNALAKYLKDQSQSHTDQSATHGAEGSDSPDIETLAAGTPITGLTTPPAKNPV